MTTRVVRVLSLIPTIWLSSVYTTKTESLQWLSNREFEFIRTLKVQSYAIFVHKADGPEPMTRKRASESGGETHAHMKVVHRDLTPDIHVRTKTLVRNPDLSLHTTFCNSQPSKHLQLIRHQHLRSARHLLHHDEPPLLEPGLLLINFDTRTRRTRIIAQSDRSARALHDSIAAHGLVL